MRFIFLVIVILSVQSCSGSPQSGSEKEIEKVSEKPSPQFFGRLVYTAEASGTDQSGVDLFKAGAASQVELLNTLKKFRMIENGGFFKTNAIADLDSNKAFWMYPDKKEYEKCGMMNLDATDPAVKAFMPKFFTPPQLDETGEKETILGKECKKFTISNSSILKAGSTGFVWLWTEKDYPPSRFEFETEWKKNITPLPLNLNQPHGVVMKMEITEGGVIVVYKATEMEEKEIPSGEFEVPSDYTMKKSKD